MHGAIPRESVPACAALQAHTEQVCSGTDADFALQINSFPERFSVSLTEWHGYFYAGALNRRTPTSRKPSRRLGFPFHYSSYGNAK